MKSIGTTERRIVTAMLLTAVLPLVCAVALVNHIVRAEMRSLPDVKAQLTRTTALYSDLAKAMKQAFRHEASWMAADGSLRAAVAAKDEAKMAARLKQLVAAHASVVSLRVELPRPVVVKRDRPVDSRSERPFEVRRSVGDGVVLSLVFAADRRRFDEMADNRRFAAAHRAWLNQRGGLGVLQRYAGELVALLLVTALLAWLVGTLVVQPFARRIRVLGEATDAVADGDLTVRVEVSEDDELGGLTHAFNRMLEQLGRSRARIEFLRRIGQWQTIARRLAHEIKNPLTPIQLAVEECHQRYAGDDHGFAALLDETHEIVVEEVASLRRLVGEFAEFARMPRATLKHGDLGDYLNDARPRLEREVAQEPEVEIAFRFDVAEVEMPLVLDHTMFYRVLANLVVNAAQATQSLLRQQPGVVRLSAACEGAWCVIDVDDNGPGIPGALRASVFDPYMTTKKDGTGLGLTIVKKVVMDHGGEIEAIKSPLGGARFRMRLPLAGTEPSEVALSQSLLAPVSG